MVGLLLLSPGCVLRYYLTNLPRPQVKAKLYCMEIRKATSGSKMAFLKA